MRSPFMFFPFLALIFGILFVFVIFLFALVQVGAITVAFTKLGLTSNQVFLVLFGTLFGSMINLPIYSKPIENPLRDIQSPLRGMWRHYHLDRYQRIAQFTRQTVAVNIGGCLIPCLLSVHFISQIGFSPGLVLSVILIAVATYKLARPIPGVGIGIPFLIPPLLAVLASWLLAPQDQTAHVAYIAGSVGTLLGADVFKLLDPRTLKDLQAPMLSIGGAGTFDGIFLAGILAVLLA